MRIIFPLNESIPAEPDAAFVPEYTAARQAGWTCELYSLRALRLGSVREALLPCHRPSFTNEKIIHRGWGILDHDYTALHDELKRLTYEPVVTPIQYAQTRYAPLAYPLISSRAAPIVWMEGSDRKAAWALYQRLPDGNALIKDYAKSAKARWHQACFIPAGTSRARFMEIMEAFMQTRGPLFEKGIVFRRLSPLMQRGQDMQGTPLFETYRFFFWYGRILESVSGVPGPLNLSDQEQITDYAKRFASPFLSIDIGRLVDGNWVIVETDDGGVSALPATVSLEDFYRELKQYAPAEAF